MSEEKSIEIDTMLDYEMACALVEKNIIDTSYWEVNQ
jgi:CMP-N-acetylneuraminic acid synthetase